MTEREQSIYAREIRLLGEDVFQKITSKRVIIFGVGGVGGWCAESLVRSGICHLTIVDFDVVAASNCNRQLVATEESIGQVKVDVLRERLLKINPDAEIEAIHQKYTAETADSFALETYDYVIDAIDSIEHKAHLILHVTSMEGNSPKLFSSMGAALRINPFMVREAEFWNVAGDPLARALRNRFKKNKTFPAKKFHCVYSQEAARQNKEVPAQDSELSNHEQGNGTAAHVVAIFGFSLAGLVIQDIEKQFANK